MSKTSSSVLYYTSFCIKTGFNVLRSQVLRLEHPTATRDPRHRRCIFFRSFRVRLKGRKGKELFGLVSRQCCCKQRGGNHWTSAPRQKPGKKLALKLGMDTQVWFYSSAILLISHHVFYKASCNLNLCTPRWWDRAPSLALNNWIIYLWFIQSQLEAPLKQPARLQRWAQSSHTQMCIWAEIKCNSAAC